MSGQELDRARHMMDALRHEAIVCVDRVVVLPETRSTQDAARELAGGRPGLMVLADRQTAGRGRLGRTWVQGGDLGLAATVVMGTASIAPERLSLLAGLAAALAVEEMLYGAGVDGPVGLRWPNDVVEHAPQGRGRGAGRKFAGVLIEAADGLAYVGVGINVNQGVEDFPEYLRGRACSIRQIAAAEGDWRGSGALDRWELALNLIRSLERVLSPRFEVMSEWSKRDVLVGTRQKLLNNGRTMVGRVISVDPMSLITLRTDDGEFRQLPALSTSIVHE